MSVSRATPPVRLLARNVRDERRTAGVAHFRKEGWRAGQSPASHRAAKPIIAGPTDYMGAPKAISASQPDVRHRGYAPVRRRYVAPYIPPSASFVALSEARLRRPSE